MPHERLVLASKILISSCVCFPRSSFCLSPSLLSGYLPSDFASYFPLFCIASLSPPCLFIAFILLLLVVLAQGIDYIVLQKQDTWSHLCTASHFMSLLMLPLIRKNNVFSKLFYFTLPQCYQFQGYFHKFVSLVGKMQGIICKIFWGGGNLLITFFAPQIRF